MATDLVVAEHRSLFHIADDLQAYFETLGMLEAQIEATPDEQEKAALRAEYGEACRDMDRLGAELAQKTDSSAGVLTRLETEAAMVKAERDRLAKRQKTYEATAEWLERYVVSVMQQKGLKTLKTTANTLSLRPSEAVVILDAEAVPDEYKTVTVKLPMKMWYAACGAMDVFAPPSVKREFDAIRPDETIQKAPIKKALKAGTAVPGADLVSRDSLVRR
ncbi:MAG TPA: siphovirus Gp157 family protein [Bryobacteraceae bacterium]|nr:siphovirus Gp157 family protein [Bryobacteraceae bacterium]